jgi:drug/metabolite transporter (DMT)-like permease
MSSSPSASRLIVPVAPGIAAATTLALSDVLAKVVLQSGCDVVTMLSFRGIVGLIFMAIWLRIGSKAKADARARWIALGVGLIFGGLVFCLFKAIEAIDVPTAVLSYFAYPLLTGLAASLLGLEPLRWRGVVCAVAAFLGLAVMVGAHPAGLAFAGVAYALGAACCRTAILLVTRAYLTGADARLTTWYSLISSTLIFLALSAGTMSVNPPQTAQGWVAIVGMSIAITAGILFIFVSTARIGAFRTALIMHIEPLTAMILSAILLGEVITPVQGLGSAIMLAALIAFQLWR